MAQRLQEFCALLVEDNFGHSCQQIFSALAEQGRLSRPQLQRITQLPGRQLRHALTVLTQQHILRHHTDDDDICRYQVDWRNTYNLTRSNRIISLVEERYGEGAAKIVANLLQLGHARVGDLAQAFDLEPSPKRDSEIEACDEHLNGDAETNGTGTTHKTNASKIITIGQFHSTLHKLLQAGFLVKMSKRSYMPAADLRDEIEEAVISEHFPDRKITGPKKQGQFKSAVQNLKRKWREADEFSDRRDLDSRGTFRHTGNANAKRAKYNGVQPNGIGHSVGDHDENVVRLPTEMVVRVNYAQCTLAFRSQRLQQLAQPYLGSVTATVYGTLLQVLEAKLQGRDDDLKDSSDEDDDKDDLPLATTIEVANILDPSLDLGLGVHDVKDFTKIPNGNSKGKKRVKNHDSFPELGIKEEYASDDDDMINGYSSYEDRGTRLSLVEEHLKLLEEHPKRFCSRVGGGGRGEWQVDFASLTDTLIGADIDSTILARFGKIHMRIIRLLRERGRLEEKQVASLTLMRSKDVRAILTELQYAGIAESQEVPRDATRMAARTTYLWFHDQARVQNLILQQTYQGMSRVLQRLRQERENYKSAIEKAEMMDVKQEALSQHERNAVQQWREVEEKLLIQVQRMDDLVARLRDFSGKDTTLVS